MIRIFIENPASSYYNLSLKIDDFPELSKTADDFCLPDFLQVDRAKELKRLVSELIQYWIQRIENLESDESTFLAFNLSDDGISGMMIKKVSDGFKMGWFYTLQTQGWLVNRSNIDDKTKNLLFVDEENCEWSMSEEELMKDLRQSLAELT